MASLDYWIVILLFKAQTYLQPHYDNGIFGNVYILAGLRNKHCYHRIDLPLKKGPLLIYGCDADLLHFYHSKI